MLYPFMVTNIFHTSSSLPKLMALFISHYITIDMFRSFYTM